MQAYLLHKVLKSLCFLIVVSRVELEKIRNVPVFTRMRLQRMVFFYVGTRKQLVGIAFINMKC